MQPHLRPSRPLHLRVLLILTVLILTYNLRPPTPSSSPYSNLAVISLSASPSRLGYELPLTLQSLLSQSASPKHIRVHIHSSHAHLIDHPDHRALKQVLEKAKEKVEVVVVEEDEGPATKFLPVLRWVLDSAQKQTDGKTRDEWLDLPLVIVDDDHVYTPYLLSTLLSHHIPSKTSKPWVPSLRGWRINPSLTWGVTPDLLSHHVIHGWDLPSSSQPWRVGVVTANEGYLLCARWLLDPARLKEGNTLVGSAPILDRHTPSSPLHLVDDILISGHLSLLRIPRFVVPLSPPSAAPSVDISRSHPLESHMAKDGMSRGQANNWALEWFKSGWRGEGGEVIYDRSVGPVRKGWVGRKWVGVRGWWRQRVGMGWEKW